MIRRNLLAVIAVIGFFLEPVKVNADEVDFNLEVRPILSDHCFVCHGPDSKTREAGLRLDQRKSATSMLESGTTAIVDGKPEQSELYRRITSNDADLRMPPHDGAKPLSAGKIATLKLWIEQGAKYEDHWAFVTPRRPELPNVKNQKWVKNPIDQFVLARLEKEQLSPSRRASRETLIRRVAFDTTGLPPTLEEIDAYLADVKPGAYERMLDRYLDSSAYGEHMARHWLDLARYADSNGYQYDTEREQWVWRDWVINAYNENRPFDQFTIEQLAGDLLPEATPQQRLATGFNRNHGITIEGGIIDEEYRTEYVMDRLVTTGTVWLGMTIGCARCHDHKYDPISQKEFYQLLAFFNQVPERGMRGFDPKERIPSPYDPGKMSELEQQIAPLQAELRKPFSVEEETEQWARNISDSTNLGWTVLPPNKAKSTGGTTLKVLDDHSILAGGANPQKDIYEITAKTVLSGITAVRLEVLTHESLPGGGPGRHSNSNFVLSEIELTVVSVKDNSVQQTVKFSRAYADYSQKNYEIGKAIDGEVRNNNGWAVDGPTRKQSASAVFIATTPFGFDGGTELRFRLRHEAGFATHGIGRPRFSVTADPESELTLHGTPAEIRAIAKLSSDKRTSEQSKTLQEYFLKHHDPRDGLRRQVSKLQNQIAALFPATLVMSELANPRKTFVLNRGMYNEPTIEVQAGTPSIFPPITENSSAKRLQLAKWLFDPKHPLTSRVAVNRYWQRCFGIGLVKTSEDFGLQGESPSHPKLLDWLAVEFMDTKWNVKNIQRLILTSATYQQSSHAGKAAYLHDPENRLLARGPRMRLDAEEIRDAALSASGQLIKDVGGKSVFPYQPKGIWLELNNRPGYSKAYPEGTGADLHRRSLYTFWKRTAPSPMLKTFDAPEREFCTIRRSRTNTPLQALLLMNGPQFIEAARHLGARMISEGGASVDDRLRFGFRLVVARNPSSSELNVLRDSYVADLKKFTSSETSMHKMIGDTPIPAQLKSRLPEWAACTSIARLLLNLNETITKG